MARPTPVRFIIGITLTAAFFNFGLGDDADNQPALQDCQKADKRVDAWIAALRKERTRIGSKALEEIRDENKTESVVDRLVVQLRHEDRGRRAEAAELLGRFRTDAVRAMPALLKALKDPQEIVRDSAASALGQIGPEARSAVAALGKLPQRIALA